MPICIDSEQTVPITLPTDAAKPEGRRTVFHARFLSPREQRRVKEQIVEASRIRNRWQPSGDLEADTLAEDDALAEARLVLAKAAMIGLSRAENFRDEIGREVPLSAENLRDLLQVRELSRLAWDTIDVPAARIDDFFVSGSPSASSMPEPASSAPTAPAIASESIPPTTPS